MKRACVLLAEGFEEIEALTPVDYLRRAGAEVTTIGVSGARVRGGHGIVVETDSGIEAASRDWDCVILPGGGKGADNLAASPAVVDCVRRHAASGALVAAICAAPAVVLHKACGLLAGRRFTGYPGTEAIVSGAIFSVDRVVVDGNIVTARAAGCAGEFAYAIIAALLGEEEADELASKVLL